METEPRRSLATFDDVLAHLERRHGVVSRHAQSVLVTIAPGQRVNVAAPAPDRLEILATACGELSLLPDRALRVSRSLTLGALVLDDGRYLVRHIVHLGTDAAVLDKVLAEVARNAAEVRRAAAARPATDLFTYFAA